MKRVLVLISIMIQVVLSCGNGNKNTEPLSLNANSTEVLVFIDKSASVSFAQADVKAKAKGAIANAINRLKQGNDRIKVFYIHRNTGAVSADFTYTMPQLHINMKEGKLKVNTARKAYYQKIGKQKIEVLDQIMNRVSLHNGGSTSRGTDIIGAFEVASKSVSANADKYLLILSDGIQIANGFTNAAVNNNNQAKQLASKHLAKIGGQYTIDKGNIANAEAMLVLPYSSISSSHNKFINVYWETFLAPYGVRLAVQ